MVSGPSSLRHRLFAGLALLALVVAQVLPWPPVRGPSAGAARSAAIAGSRTPAICPHHPQGCPRDCLCPKLHPDADGEGSAVAAGPALVQCTERGVWAPDAPGICLPALPFAIRIPEPIGILRGPAPAATAKGFRPAPGKIPIA
jgi:hypothetical protein